jgi:hypothetical protein
MPLQLDTLRNQGIYWRFLRLEQERGIGREVDRLGDADVFEEAIAKPVTHGDDGLSRGVECLRDRPSGRLEGKGPALIA